MQKKLCKHKSLRKITVINLGRFNWSDLYDNYYRALYLNNCVKLLKLNKKWTEEYEMVFSNKPSKDLWCRTLVSLTFCTNLFEWNWVFIMLLQFLYVIFFSRVQLLLFLLLFLKPCNSAFHDLCFLVDLWQSYVFSVAISNMSVSLIICCTVLS